MDTGMAGGNNSLDTQLVEQREGDITGELDVLSLGMTADDIHRVTGRVGTAEKFWDSKLDLTNVRNKVEKYWLNNYYSSSDLYDFQAEYKDPRIAIAIETLVSLVSSNPAQPMVTQAYDTDASYELAQQHAKALLAKYEDLYLKAEFQMVARHLLIGYRLGVQKVGWDDTIGQLQPDGSRFGDMTVRTLRPQRVVIDAGAQNINDIPLVAEYCSAMVEDLMARYPDKKEDIMKEAGVQNGVKFDFTKRVGYMEVHFTTTDKKSNKRVEGIAWKYKGVILDSTKTPFWNYDETTTDSTGQVKQANFLEKPAKPYIFYNFLNLGRWVIDDISLTEWAATLQDIHDKRGRQIVENADQMNGGWVFNTRMVKATDAAAWVNNPGDKILANGNVNEAVARLNAPQLDPMVLNDKMDARNEIDNVFGTHGAIKGEVTAAKTLGQDVLSQRGDTARLNTLVTAIEDGSDRLYKFMTQVMKVFYNEPQLIRYSPQDDSTTFFSHGADQIEPGVAIRVKSGSVLPEDPIAKKQETMQLLPILDPLSIAQGLNKPNPKEWAKQNLYFRIFPDKYISEILGVNPDAQGTGDPKALQDIQMLTAGKDVPVDPNVTKEYLATFQQFIQSPQFQQLPPEIKQAIVQHAQQALGAAKQAMGMQDQRPGMPQQAQQPQQPGQQNPQQQVGVQESSLMKNNSFANGMNAQQQQGMRA